MCWGQDSKQGYQIPNPHSQLLLHNTEPQPRGRGDMGPGKQWRTPGWDQSLSSTTVPQGPDCRVGVMQGEAGRVGGRTASGAPEVSKLPQAINGARER